MIELPKMLEKKKISLVLVIHCKGQKLLRTKKERKSVHLIFLSKATCKDSKAYKFCPGQGPNSGLDSEN